MFKALQPRIVAGLLVGALLTAPLIAVLYAAWGLIGLPFVPYDMFDLMARVLPGRVITSGIDMMVTIIRTLDIGPTSVVAKAAEHALATGGLFITGVIAGGVLFGVLRMVDVRRAYGVGFALGAIFGIAGAADQPPCGSDCNHATHPQQQSVRALYQNVELLHFQL